jgi:hypothetical protein
LDFEEEAANLDKKELRGVVCLLHYTAPTSPEEY